MGANEADLKEKMSKINGLIFPGGDMYLLDDNRDYTYYASQVKILYDKAKELNDEGIYFPVWGTCLGF